MQIGCCASIDKSAELKAAGFDYVEAALVSLKPDEDEASFAPVLADYQASALPVQAFNLFLPRDLKVVGPEVDEDRMRQYVQRALPRAQQIGATRIVFGSGGSRNIPDGFPRNQAVDQIVHFLRIVADVADQTGIVIAIEPLNTRESNVINSVAEGVEIAQQADRAAIRVLADFYHMDEEDEPLQHLVTCKDWLAHIHVADTDRGAPGTGQYPYTEFVEKLREAGYDGMVSVECRWQDFSSEIGPAAAFLKQMLS